jgi:hypothetical protein
MKAIFASLFAASFALFAVASHAAMPAAGTAIYADEDKKDEAKNPAPTTEQKNDEEGKDKEKKPEGDDKKS